MKFPDPFLSYPFQVVALLSEPACGMMVNITINYNYIEISEPHGMCFDIEGKKFVLDPDLQGASPRAFLYYKYDEDISPYPSKFISGNLLLLSFLVIIIIIPIFDICCTHLWCR